MKTKTKVTVTTLTAAPRPIRKMLGRLLVLIPATVWLGLTGGIPAQAAPGELDLTFGVNGRVTTDFLAPSSDTGYQVFLRSDGSFVIAGRSDGFEGIRIALAFYNQDGQLQNRVDVDAGVPRYITDEGCPAEIRITDFAFDAGGRVLVAGTAVSATSCCGCGGLSDFTVVRLNTDGTLDTTFGDGGRATIDVGGYDEVTAVAVDPAGRVVLAGRTYDVSTSTHLFAAVRLNADGSLDTSFDGDGRATVPGLLGASAMAVDAAGRVVLAGLDGAVRLNLDGSVDTTFNGLITFNVPPSLGVGPTAVAVDPNGRIVIAAWLGVVVGAGEVVRLNPDGSLDPSFDGDGRASILFDAYERFEPKAVVVDVAGRIVVAGAAASGSSEGGFVSQFAVARLNADGSLDTTFDGDGRTIIDFGGYGSAAAVVLDAAGRILLAGYATSAAQDLDFAVARLQGYSVAGIGQNLEQATGTALQNAITEILSNPAIPDAAANSVQKALDQIIGNNGGAANNGAGDKLQAGQLVAGLIKMRKAIQDLQTAAAQGFNSTALQQQITEQARLAVRVAIEAAKAVLGQNHPAILTAQNFAAQGDTLLAAGNYLGAMDKYKAAAQQLP